MGLSSRSAIVREFDWPCRCRRASYPFGAGLHFGRRLYLRYEKSPIVRSNRETRSPLVTLGRIPLQSELKPRIPIQKLRLSVQDKLAPILKETIRSMKFTARIPVTASLLALLLITATGGNRLKARDQLTKGVQAFKNARYEEAVNHFQQSIALDPNYEDAKLYLTTAYSYQVVPNLDTPENLAIAQKALDGFNAGLAKDPHDLTALKQIASINRNIKKFDVAKEYEKKVIAIAPNDPEAYYTVGFVDWVLAYKNATTILAADGLTDVGDGNPKKSKAACEKLKAANTDLDSERLQYLTKAVELNPTYDDAMQYLQLTYRRKADLERGDEAARKAHMAQVYT